MDILKILRDWGLGALVFLGLASQPTYFGEPRYDKGILTVELQDAFPESVETLMLYGVPIQIEYHVRLYEEVGYKDQVIKKRVVYDRKTGLAQCWLDGKPESQFNLSQAKTWLKQFLLDLTQRRTSQVTLRAILVVEGRSIQESQGLWGGWPSMVWRP